MIHDPQSGRDASVEDDRPVIAQGSLAQIGPTIPVRWVKLVTVAHNEQIKWVRQWWIKRRGRGGEGVLNCLKIASDGMETKLSLLGSFQFLKGCQPNSQRPLQRR